MANVNDIVTRLPVWAQKRYGGNSNSKFVGWINDLLELLSTEGLLMRELHFETGVEVKDNYWIDTPVGLQSVNRIYNPRNSDQQFNWKMVNNRIRIIGAVIEDQESPETASSFSNYLTTAITVNIADAAEGDYENYLLKITAGTYANNAYIISTNDASSAGTCKLYFLHPLSAALDGIKITAASLISPDYYVMLDYTSSYSTVPNGTTEIPIADTQERRITEAWLKWKFQADISPSSDEARAAEVGFLSVLRDVKIAIRGNTGGRIKPRYIPGLTQYSYGSSDFTKEFEADL